MKLKFKIQPFQTAAVNAVADLFRGQEKRSGTFTIEQESQMNMVDNGYGVGNLLTLSDKQLTANMNDIQKRHSLPLTEVLEGNQFSWKWKQERAKPMFIRKPSLNSTVSTAFQSLL